MEKYKKRIRTASIVAGILTVLVIAAAASIAWKYHDMILPACIVGTVVILINLTYVFVSSKTTLSDIFADFKGEINESLIASFMENPFPVCLIDSAGSILWCNDSFQNVFHGGEELINKKIFALTGLKMQDMESEALSGRTVWVSSISKFFRVRATEFKASDVKRLGVSRPEYADQDDDGKNDSKYHLRMLHWMDVTEHVLLKKSFDEEQACVIHIKLDNLEDILEQAPDDRKAALAGEIEKLIRQWAIKTRGSLVRVSKMKFVLICSRRSLDIAMQNKFPVLEEVRELQTGGDIPASLSIGVGAEGKSLLETDEFAKAALDLAQDRGGDQAVVSTGGNIEYFGGRQLAGGKRNKGRSRVVSVAFMQLVEQSERVFIMGHKTPDMDAFGASIGVARLVKSKNKQAYIIVNSTKAIEMPYKQALDTGEYTFVRSEQAVNLAHPGDLIVMVDTHRPGLADGEELLGISDRVVIIDHHRRNPDIVKNPVLVHLEPYASSACELVTEMIQYALTAKKPISDVEAGLLLSGIALDTRNFSIKTGVPTFDAASWLKRQGANTIAVRRFFQTELGQFREKAEIISGIERLEGDMVMGFLRRPGSDVSVLIAAVADQLLEIRGMKASFVLGMEADGKVRVSARSLGDINVQLIMEKLGGGGNLTTAGAQLSMSFDDAAVKVRKTVAEYLQETEQKRQQKALELQRQKELKKSKENKEV